MEANFSASTLYMYMTCKFTQFSFLKIINKDKISWIADDRNLLVKSIQEKKKNRPWRWVNSQFWGGAGAPPPGPVARWFLPSVRCIPPTALSAPLPASQAPSSWHLLYDNFTLSFSIQRFL